MRVFYKPRAGEDVSTIFAVAPKLVQLIRLQGAPEAPVKNIDFRSIIFECSTWLQPSDEGFASRLGRQHLKRKQAVKTSPSRCNPCPECKEHSV